MKIDKHNLSHWVLLARLFIVALIASIIRLFVKKHPLVLFYGHKLNGNLLPIFTMCNKRGIGYFGNIDKKYLQSIESEHQTVLHLCSLKSIPILAKTGVVITSHGLHSLIIFKLLSDVKFVDVWHGIPFKGFDKSDFLLQLTYNEIWVASEFHKRLYTERYEFDQKNVFVTGYARTDILINRKCNINDLRRKYKIPPNIKVIAFCPTWKQDDKNRNIFPFNTEEVDFLSKINEFCYSKNILFIIRTHLNTKNNNSIHYKNLYFLDADSYPVTEEILLISDVLICDWSSICFDYLLLKRPTIFLDVTIPFKKGLSIPAAFRYGDIANSIEAIFDFINEYIYDENVFYQRNRGKIEEVTAIIYGEYCDGRSSERCMNRLLKLLD